MDARFILPPLSICEQLISKVEQTMSEKDKLEIQGIQNLKFFVILIRSLSMTLIS